MNGKGSGLTNYTTFNLTLNGGGNQNNRLSRFYIEHTRLTCGYLTTRNDQQPTCRNVTCGNHRLTNKHCLQGCPQLRNNRKKYNIQGSM